MKKIKAVEIFKIDIMPDIKKEERKISLKFRDLPMRRQAWNDFCDYLCMEGEITDAQRMNWTQPAICN
jgi:hypothetical protein